MSKLLYISAVGHSGSTLVDMLCGVHPEIFSMGEMMWLPWNFERSHQAEYPIENGARCSCHQKFLDCSVWSRIMDRLESRRGSPCLSSDPQCNFPLMLLRRNADYGQGRTFGYHLLRETLRREVQLLSGCGPLKKYTESRERAKTANNWELIDAVGEETGSQWVTDSSKDPLRLMLLHASRPKDAVCLVVIRDLRGVVHSYQKLGEPRVVKIMKHWLRYYTNTLRMLRKLEIPHRVVRYESLCSEPEIALHEIWRFCNLPEQHGEIVMRKGEHHMTAGNGMRFKEEIRVREDTNWQGKLDASIAKTASAYQNKFWAQSGLDNNWAE